MTPFEIENLVFLISDLDLAPQNDHARDFYDLHWLEVLDLENYRRDLEYMHYCNVHPRLSRKSDVSKSRSCSLFSSDE